MTTEPYDWTRFSIAMYYRADIEQVWEAWATPGGLESFFIETCEATMADGRNLGAADSVRPGTRYRWTWRHGHVLDGVFTDVEDGRRLGFTFGAMNVDVRFDATDAGTRVELLQSDISPTDEGRLWGHLNCRSCWIFFMTNLSSILATGVDLRHENPLFVSSMEVGFVAPTIEDGGDGNPPAAADVDLDDGF